MTLSDRPARSVGFGIEAQRINCHHNFTPREVHNGQERRVMSRSDELPDLVVVEGREDRLGKSAG
jgi:hypothetical protein